jgi:2-oxoglutarate ferredoxin oxidoreductase subunit beta
MSGETTDGPKRQDYKGLGSTLCRGCGHDSISNQIISAAFELEIPPHRLVKLSGIGCSSKSVAYFLNRSHGFNAVHGRMPTVATGVYLANRSLRPIGVSGDGDSGSIGLGHFKHLLRRNARTVYVIENNGVYGLTKGQFSATAEEGLEAEAGGDEPLPADRPLPRGAGLRRHVRRALVLGGRQAAPHAAEGGARPPGHGGDRRHQPLRHVQRPRPHELRLRQGPPEILHDIFFVPPEEEITVDYEPGTTVDVRMHDGTTIRLKKLEREYDPTRRVHAMDLVEQSRSEGLFVTGLLYVTEDVPDLAETLDLVDEPLASLEERRIRPTAEAFDAVLRDLSLRSDDR